jgi:hypothetical protein
MNTATALSRHDAARLLIDAAEKILDMQHGEGFAAAHPDEVGEFLMDVSLGLWVKQADRLAESLGVTP